LYDNRSAANVQAPILAPGHPGTRSGLLKKTDTETYLNTLQVDMRFVEASIQRLIDIAGAINV
jgi:hypothetical protein